MGKVIESSYNIIQRLEKEVDGFGYVVMNSFSGSIDLVKEDAIRFFYDKNASDTTDKELLDYLIHRGYFYTYPEAEREKVLAVQQAMAKSKKSHPKLIILTTYSCNLNCSYCYQKSLKRSPSVISPDMINAFFAYIKQNGYRDITLDIIGGEPLLDNAPSKEAMQAIVAGCEDNNLRFRVITNGTNLLSYLDMLAHTDALDFVQVTIDGPPDIQIERRGYQGRDYMDRFIQGISAALQQGIRIAARTNIDAENIATLVALYHWYESCGWAGQKNFFPYLSPVHDHYACASCNDMFDECRILDTLLAYEDQYPDIIGKYNKSNFLAYQYLKTPFATKHFTLPRYYRCEANTNQLVFDPEGLIYPCIEAAGRPEHAIGRYMPAFELTDDRVRAWREDRLVTNLDTCIDCEICFICGGDCTWGVFNMDQAAQDNGCRSRIDSLKLLLKKRGHLLAAASE